MSTHDSSLGVSQERVHVDCATASGNSTQIIGNVTIAPAKASYLPLLVDGSDSDYTWWKDRNETRAPNTCQWFLSHDSYLSWLSADTGVPLLVSADPGCGKSVLAKYLVDSRFEGSVPDNVSICHFFFKDGPGLQSKIEHALCALLHQLFCQQPHLVEAHFHEHAERHSRGLASNVSLLWDILVKATSDPTARPVILVLDALDECLQDNDNIGRLLRLLTAYFRRGCGTRWKIIMTSRPYYSTMLYIEKLENRFPKIRIRGEDDCEAIREEIESVISYRIDGMTQFAPDLRQYAKEQFLAVPHRTYLWCALAFDYLMYARDIKRTRTGIRRALEHIPRTVDDAYEKILARSTNYTAARRALQIVFAAGRPLQLREMQIMLDGLGEEDVTSLPKDSVPRKNFDDLEWENDVDFKDRLRELCGLLLAVYNGRVSFLHQTAKEFLSSERMIPPPNAGPEYRWAGRIFHCDGATILAQVSVVFLAVFDHSHFDGKTFEDVKCSGLDTGIFCYAVENWDHHLRDANPKHEDVQLALLPLVATISKSFFAPWFDLPEELKISEWIDETSSDLMIACFFDLYTIVELLSETGHEARWQPDLQDRLKRTALAYAVHAGSYATATNLLYYKLEDVNLRHAPVYNPLHNAIKGNQTEIVRALLDYDDIDATIVDVEGRPPLIAAFVHGADDIVQLMLGFRRVQELNVKDSDGGTLLTYAATNGDTELVKQLLASGRVDIGVKDNTGTTTLSYAAMGNEDASPEDLAVVAQLLLETRQVEIDAKDEDGRTALSLAAETGNYRLVQLLLDTDEVDIESEDVDGRTPLWYAQNPVEDPGCCDEEWRLRTCTILRERLRPQRGQK